MIWGSGGSKSRLAKAAGAEPAGQMRDEKLHAVVARSTFRSQMSKKCTPLWREAHVQVKMYKTHHARTVSMPDGSQAYLLLHKALNGLRDASLHWLNLLSDTTFGSWDVEKVHVVVARSTFRSQNVKNTRGSDHFWMLRCRSAWQVQGIVDLVESEQNLRVL